MENIYSGYTSGYSSGIVDPPKKKKKKKIYINGGTLPIVGKSGTQYLPGDEIDNPTVEFGPKFTQNFPMIQLQ